MLAEPACAQLGSAVITVRFRRWRVIGMEFGPVSEALVRVIIAADGSSRHERVDGRPMGEIQERCREQLAAVESRLLREFRERRTTSTASLRRVESATLTPRPTGTRAGFQAMRDRARDTQQPPSGEASPGGAAVQPVAQKPTSAVFRCDRQAITDRINRLRAKDPLTPPPVAAQPTPLPAPAPPKVDTGERLREAQRKSIAEMAALRERRFREARERAGDDALVPTDLPLTPQVGMPEKTTSSVFRCDRQEITDRITRLRSKPAADEPPATGTAADEPAEVWQDGPDRPRI